MPERTVSFELVVNDNVDVGISECRYSWIDIEAKQLDVTIEVVLPHVYSEACTFPEANL